MHRAIFAAAPALLAVALTVLGSTDASAQTPSPIAEKSAFYADVRVKHYDAALAAGAAYRKRYPHDDRFSLDYAYALLSAHRTAEGVAVLEELKNSPVVPVRTAARKQLLAQAPPPRSASAATPAGAASPPPFTNAYELLAGGDLGAAREAFETTLVTHPTDAAAWRQLSYIDFVLKDRPAMIVALDRYIALKPDDDKAKLERAYALLAEGKRAEADAALAGLEQSKDPEIAHAAKQQLIAATAGTGKPTRVNVFGYGDFDSRFHDTFYGLDARYTIAPTKIEPYVALHFSDDSKAGSVPATAILNDNVIILALGLRTKISPIAYAFIEAGEAQSLLTGNFETDLRYGALLSTRLGAGGYKSQTQIDASITHYSRYIDTIMYGNVAHDFYIGSKVVRGVVGTNVALDTSRDFYNNAAEGFGGLQVRSGPATFRLVAVAGTYLGRGIDAPESTYTSIRAIILFGYSH